MLQPLATGRFKRDRKLAAKRGKDLAKLHAVMDLLINEQRETLGWHVRGRAGGKPPAPHKLPLQARLHSFKNHYLLMLNNDRLADVLRHLPAVLGWEVLRQGHALLRDRALYRAYPELMRLLPKVLRRRREVMRRRRASAAEMRRWFGAR